MSNPLQPHGLQHARFPCPSPYPGACSNSCPLSQWCHPTISSSVVSFTSCLQSFPGSGSFLMSQLFAAGGQRIGASASAPVLPMNTQGWFPLGLTGSISLQSKGLSRVFSNTTVQKHQFFNHFSYVQFFAILWTTAHQAPLSMGFSRKEYWTGLLCPPPGDLWHSALTCVSCSFCIAGGFFTSDHQPGKSRE